LTALKLLSEEELVRSLKANQRQAYEYLYQNYSGALMGIITRIVKDTEKSEDLLQDVFLKIWKKINDYDASKGRLFTWMVNIARNTAIDAYRKDKNVWLEDLDGKVNTIDLLNVTDTSNHNFDVKSITENLKTDRKILIDMVYFQGYTQEEAAEILQIPLGTAKSRIRIALQDLKAYFRI
jgi:RNA polymerase sigma-70 factor (ECF subfamily)